MRFNFENIKYGAIREGRLYRIYAVKSFGDVKKGNKGGLIEKEDNLSESGDCWLYGDVELCADDRISGNIRAFGKKGII